MQRKTTSVHSFVLLIILFVPLMLQAQTRQLLMNNPVDLSPDFKDYLNTYFLADSLAAFNP